MTADEIDRTVHKHLEHVNLEIFNLLARADIKTLKAIQENNPYWLELMNIDLDYHIDKLEN